MALSVAFRDDIDIMSAVAGSTGTCCHRATLIGQQHSDVTHGVLLALIVLLRRDQRQLGDRNTGLSLSDIKARRP